MTDNIDSQNGFYCLVAGGAPTISEVLVSSTLQHHIESAINLYEQLTGEKLPVEDLATMKELANSHLGKQDVQPSNTLDTDDEHFIAFLYQSTDSSKSETHAGTTPHNVQGSGDSGLANHPNGWPELKTQNKDLVLKTLMPTGTGRSETNVVSMAMIPGTKNDNASSTPNQSAVDRSIQNRMAQLGQLQDLGASSLLESSDSHQTARKNQRNVGITSGSVRSTMVSISSHDSSENQIIDLNSLMAALDDYIAKANEGKTGVPINYYLKCITPRTIAVQWLEKYYPGMLHEQSDEPSDAQ